MGLYLDQKNSCSSASSLNSSRVQKERPTVLLPVNAIQTEAYGNSVHISLSPLSRELSVCKTVSDTAIVQTLATDTQDDNGTQ